MTAFLYPGQGSQSPGMGRDLYEHSPILREYFEKAQSYLPDILNVIFEGSQSDLSRTHYAQIGLLVVESALTHVLKDLGHEPKVCCGHSLGEFSALVGCEALSFEDALRLVDARGRFMTEMVPPGGMAAVLGLDESTIRTALPPEVYVANFNGPEQTIIAGTHEALKEAETALIAAGAKRVLPLQVSGPFHSPLMVRAKEAFATFVSTAEIKRPRYPFISSVSGTYESEPERIRELLAQQICAPVQWTKVMETLGPVRAFEVGPGKVLQGLCKRMKGGPEPVLSAGTLEACKNLDRRG